MRGTTYVSGGKLEVALLFLGSTGTAVLLDELLEPGCVGAPQLVDTLTVLDEYEGGHGAHAVRSSDLSLLIDIHLQGKGACAFEDDVSQESISLNSSEKTNNELGAKVGMYLDKIDCGVLVAQLNEDGRDRVAGATPLNKRKVELPRVRDAHL